MDCAWISSRSWLSGFLLCLAASVLGCGQTPQIATYTVEKPDRMLGGILIHEDRCWFFKLTGPREELDRKKGDFESFLKSVEITEQGPKWELPSGWKLDEGKPKEMRFATIHVPLQSKTAELSVSFLPMQEDELKFIAANINRWRSQMDQHRLSLRDLQSLSEIDTASGPAYLVSISGRLQGGSMTAPFAAGS